MSDDELYARAWPRAARLAPRVARSPRVHIPHPFAPASVYRDAMDDATRGELRPVYGGWEAFVEMWPDVARVESGEAEAVPADLPEALRDRKREALVTVRCAADATLIAVVFATPSGRSLLLTANQNADPLHRLRDETWNPTPTLLGGLLPQPAIHCPRCNRTRDVPDLDAITDKARATRRQDVRY